MYDPVHSPEPWGNRLDLKCLSTSRGHSEGQEQRARGPQQRCHCRRKKKSLSSPGDSRSETQPTPAFLDLRASLSTKWHSSQTCQPGTPKASSEGTLPSLGSQFRRLWLLIKDTLISPFYRKENENNFLLSGSLLSEVLFNSLLDPKF